MRSQVTSRQISSKKNLASTSQEQRKQINIKRGQNKQNETGRSLNEGGTKAQHNSDGKKEGFFFFLQDERIDWLRKRRRKKCSLILSAEVV